MDQDGMVLPATASGVEERVRRIRERWAAKPESSAEEFDTLELVEMGIVNLARIADALERIAVVSERFDRISRR